MYLTLPWRQTQRIKQILLILFFVWNLFDITKTHWDIGQSEARSVKDYRDAAPSRQRVFLASTHWNNEIILREHWTSAVLQLAQHVGVGNIFVSVVESGSYDNTKDALRELDEELGRIGVQRSISLDETTHEDETKKEPAAEGWIMTPRNKMELRRIPYLSRMRNLSLKPLYELVASGKRFDKVLFLNDVVFDVRDYENLLHTNGGNYAAACSMDFSKPPQYYDTFALRDSEGHPDVMTKWPYFRAKESREAIKAGRPTPVQSCWNGMVLMDASPLQDGESALNFRGVTDDLAKLHVEGSECCLIHYDNALSKRHGVWINPNVRVAYNIAAYLKVQPLSYQNHLGLIRIFFRLWENRLRRWFTSPWAKESVISDRLRKWSSEGPHRYEAGEACLIDEMQVIVKIGWAHV